MKFFTEMLTSGSGVSSKRFNALLSLSFFLGLIVWLVNKEKPVVNFELVNKCIEILEIIILALVVSISVEPILKKLGVKNILEGQAEVTKAEKGTSDVVIDNVENQNINK